MQQHRTTITIRWLLIRDWAPCIVWERRFTGGCAIRQSGSFLSWHEDGPEGGGTTAPRDEEGGQLSTRAIVPYFSERSSKVKDPMPFVLCKRGELSRQRAEESLAV